MPEITALQLMSNPVNLQTRLYEHLESKLLNGTAVLVDPNSVAMQLVEGFCDVTADYAFATELQSERRLANRAMTDADLNLHMSDYDYVGSFATPSKATIALSIDKNYVLTHGVLVNNSYRVLVIPKNTTIKLGNLEFSLYYPIRIQVDERSKVPLVTYDISEQHPLMSMDSNRVEFNELNYLGFTLIVMHITVYQFSLTKSEVVIQKETGCNTVLGYTDKFYAVRLFTDYNGKRIELSQSLVQDNYDPTVPTARLQVEQDINKFIVNIPQIYFTLGYMGLKLYVETYTTKGNIASNVGALPTDQVSFDWNLDGVQADAFSEPLRYIPTVLINIESPTTTDGTDGYTFEEKRQRVITDSFKTKAQITPIDVQNYYASYGIKVQRYQDNLTNLMYFIYKPFIDAENNIMPSTNTYLRIFPTIHENVSTIKKNVDGTMMILPNTWFRFELNQDSCVPLTDDEVNFMSTLSKEELAAEFNENRYVRTPFHIRLLPKLVYPTAIAYNLMQPSIEKMTIEEDNPNALAQMLTISENITHQGNGGGSFLIHLVVKKDYLDDIDEADITVWLSTTSTDGAIIGVAATKVGTVDDYTLYECKLETDYWITEDNEINLTNVKDESTDLNHQVALSTKFDITYLVKQTHFPDVSTPLHMYSTVPTAVKTGYCVLLKQSMIVNFGHALDDVIYNGVNLTKTKKEYLRYEVDVPCRYPTDVYQTDADNVPVFPLVKSHVAGDIIMGADGNPELLHKKGEICLDTTGNPIVKDQRVNEYLIQAPVFDGKLYISEHPTQVAFVSGLVAMFEANFQLIRDSKGYITERTNIYFKPSRTTGSAKYYTGDGVEIILPLDLTMRFKVHVDRLVTNDSSIKKAIFDSSTSLINEMLKLSIISQTDIAKAIKAKIAYVDSIDALGIEGSTTLQTLVNEDTSAQPSLKQILVLSEDKQLILQDQLELEYTAIS